MFIVLPPVKNSHTITVPWRSTLSFSPLFCPLRRGCVSIDFVYPVTIHASYCLGNECVYFVFVSVLISPQIILVVVGAAAATGWWWYYYHCCYSFINVHFQCIRSYNSTIFNGGYRFGMNAKEREQKRNRIKQTTYHNGLITHIASKCIKGKGRTNTYTNTLAERKRRRETQRSMKRELCTV